MRQSGFAWRRVRGAAFAAAVGALAAACSSSSTAPQPVRTFKFLVSNLHLPATPSDASSLAVDLNGDGHADNALGVALASLFGSGGLDAQVVLDSAIAGGSVEHLIRISSHDTTLTQDNSATVNWYVGTGGAAFPGPYTIDNNASLATFTGHFAGGTFTSTSPATMSTPVSASVKLRILGGTPFLLHLNGAAIRFTASGAVPSLVSGRIAGSLDSNQVQNTLVPSLAQAFTAVLQADSTTTTARQIEQIFDTGGCAGAVAHDYQLSPCEVGGNGLVSALLALDVQIYNSAGAYAPSAANTTPNALSAAFGFTAQLTSF